MNINSQKKSTQMEILIYEQPKLRKYGTMKEFTFGSSGSKGDGMGSDSNDGKINDAKQIDDGDSKFSD